LILHTVGFTQKPLRGFIGLLRDAGVDAVIDVRLRNNGQLSGWSKRDDLAFILETFAIGYHHRPELAPSPELLDRYRADHDWPRYTAEFPALIESRAVLPETLAFLDQFRRPCLLCSEPKPDHCHRHLLAEALAARRPGLEVVHLM
jgi:uncharacterized protein (DUF488 family)